MVVHEVPKRFRFDGAGDVGIENLQEMAESLLFGFIAKLPVGFESPVIALRIIVECHRVEAKIASQLTFFRSADGLGTLHLINRGGSKGNGRDLGISPSSDQMDIRRVIGTGSRSYGRIIKEPLLNSQNLATAC